MSGGQVDLDTVKRVDYEKWRHVVEVQLRGKWREVARECGLNAAGEIEFDWWDQVSDIEDGGDVKVRFGGGSWLMIALRRRPRHGDPPEEYPHDVTFVVVKKDGFGCFVEAPEVGKIRKGLFHAYLYGQHEPEGAIDQWVAWKMAPARERLLELFATKGKEDLLSAIGQGGYEQHWNTVKKNCYFGAVNIKHLLETCAVIAFSEGHPAAVRTRIPVDPLDAELGVTKSWIEAPEVKTP